MKIYKIYVSAGFIGTDAKYLVNSTEEDIDEIATNMAWENYCSYDSLDYDIPSIEEIMENEGVDYDEAELTRTEEISSIFIIEYEEFSPGKHVAADYEWIGVTEDDIKVYTRDSQINKILS